MTVTLLALHGSKHLTEKLCKYITVIQVRITVNIVCLTAFYVHSFDQSLMQYKLNRSTLSRYQPAEAYRFSKFGQNGDSGCFHHIPDNMPVSLQPFAFFSRVLTHDMNRHMIFDK